jgi:tetratricopeptide (TPR) repeat protein
MRRLFYVAIMLAAMSFSGCSLQSMVKMANDQQMTVTPNPLELHGDSVSFEVAANLPVKMLKKGKVYTAKFYYKYGEQELAVGDIEFKADDYPNSDEVQPRASETFSFAYEPSMKSGNVEVMGVASDPRNGKSEESPRLQIAEGIITTSQLVQTVFYPAYADHGYNNQEELIPTKIDFFFDQGRSNLKYSERRSNRGKEFEAFIADKNVTRTVTITGTHSPEGPERINSKLSNDRAAVIEKYYRQQMDKYDYEGMADSINFILKPIVDDWGQFKSALADYDGISDEEKSEILNIVNGPGVFEDKEKALQKLASYKKVFKDVYPGLRAAKTEILTVKNKKTDAEISVLAREIVAGSASADTLSVEELMYAASLTPDLKEQEGIYKAAIAKADSWNAHANLAAVYVGMAMDDAANSASLAGKAETQVDLANKQKESAEAYTTAASVYLLQGNLDKASDALDKAASLGPNAETTNGLKGVQGAIQIKRAEYGDAVASLSGANETAANLFNKGLAYLLQKDNSNAISAFGDAVEAQNDFAIGYYGAAVAHAREGNGNKVVENLKQAVGYDSSLKEAAVTDLEFKNFATDAAFAEVLK